MGNACPSMHLPTAANARMDTRGLCATRSGLWQSPVGAYSACMVTARPRPPEGHTVCAAQVFQASCVSKVREPHPDCPLQAPSPPSCCNSLIVRVPGGPCPGLSPGPEGLCHLPDHAPTVMGGMPGRVPGPGLLPGPAAEAEEAHLRVQRWDLVC
ncbi:rCG57618, isoform CRA_d [Rattus norvegicus]|uniref:RCG57618, isoform CRA_d n=1 Tax=Rattus norvegicus TaxID=10116 RepID=A6JH84_RAT|nr:rCG57618, isoform CRA_d [Rattus norvegicus]